VPFVHSITARPPRRYDSVAWAEARLEESDDNITYAAVETFEIDPVDTDPSQPAEQEFTTSLATLEEGYFRLVWIDEDAAESSPTSPVYSPEHLTAVWRPTVQRVADELANRTYSAGDVDDETGEQVGTFDATTNPTTTQVERIIDAAVQKVVERFPSGLVPATSHAAAKNAAALEAALQIERGFFGEQTDDQGTTAYPSIRLARDQAFEAMVHAANARALFKENAR
jgi:hypothetical protein